MTAKYFPDWLSQKKRQENDLNMFGDFKKKLISEPIKPVQPIAAGIPETYTAPETTAKTPKAAEYVPPKMADNVQPDGTNDITIPDDDTQKPADFGASAIIGLVVAAIGAGVAAKGSSDATAAAEEMNAKQLAVNAGQWKDQMEQETRAKNMKSLEMMANERDKARISGRFRNFKQDLLKAYRGY